MLEKAREFFRKVRLKKKNHRQDGQEEEITFEISGGNCRLKTKHEEFRVEVKLCKSLYRIEKVPLDNSEEVYSEQDEKDYANQMDCYKDLHETKRRHHNKTNGINSCTDKSWGSEVDFCIKPAGSQICQPSDKLVSDDELKTSVTPCQNEDKQNLHDVTQTWNDLDLDKDSITSERNISVDAVSLSSCSVGFEISNENGDSVTDNLLESESVFVKEVHSGGNLPEERSTLSKRLCSQSGSCRQAGTSQWVSESQVITRNSNMQQNLDTFGSQRVEARSQSYEFLNLQSLKEQEKRNDLKCESTECQKTSSHTHKCMENVPQIDFNICSSSRNCSLSLEDNNLLSCGSLSEDQMLITKLPKENSNHQLPNSENMVARMKSSSEQISIIDPEESCQQFTLDLVELQENSLPTDRDEIHSSLESYPPTVVHAEEANRISLNLDHQESSTCENLVKYKKLGELELKNLQEFTAVSVDRVFSAMEQKILLTYQDGSRTEIFAKLKLKIVINTFVHIADVWTCFLGQNIYNCFTKDMDPKCGNGDPCLENSSIPLIERNTTAGIDVEICEDVQQFSRKNSIISCQHCGGNFMEIFCNEMKMKAALSTGNLINHDCLTLENMIVSKSKGPEDYKSWNSLTCFAGYYNVIYVNTQRCIEFERSVFCNLRMADIVKYLDFGAVLQRESLEKYQGLHKRTLQIIDADDHMESKLNTGMMLPEISLLSPLLQVRIPNLMVPNCNTENWKCYEPGSEVKSTKGAANCMLTDMADTDTLLNVDWWLSLLYKSYILGKKMPICNDTWDQFESREDILLFYGQINLMQEYPCKESCLPLKPSTCCRQQIMMCRSNTICELMCQPLHLNVKHIVGSKKEEESEQDSKTASNDESDTYSKFTETLRSLGEKEVKKLLSIILGKKIEKVDFEEITSVHQDRQQISSATLNCDSGEDLHKRVWQNNHIDCVQNNVQCGNPGCVHYSNGTQSPTNEDIETSLHIQEKVPTNPHYQEGVSPRPHVQENVQRNPHIQEVVSLSPHVQGNVQTNPHIQEGVSRSPHVQVEVSPSSHVQVGVSPSQLIQEDGSPSSHAEENIQSNPHVQGSVSPSTHDQKNVPLNSNFLGNGPCIRHIPEDIHSSPHIQEDIGALISKSTSQNSSRSSSILPQYVIYLRLSKNSSSLSQKSSKDVRIRAPRNLNVEEMKRIRMGTIKFFKDYQKSQKCHHHSLPSSKEVETMSIPDLLFLVQSIPKGLSFLHSFLKISRDLQIDSLIEVRPIEQQQQEAVLDTFLQQVINGDEEAIESRMRLEWFRIITFQTYPANVGISTIKLANNGFYYTGHTIETRCYFCRQTYNEWSAESNIEAVHRQISPDCPFINGRPTNNVPIHGSRRNNSPVPNRNEDDLQRVATEHLRNLNIGSTGASSNTTDLPQDQARQSPQPALAEASVDDAGVDQGTEQEPASLQTPSKSKLKRDKKKKKKEEQARAKAAASASQGAVQEVPGTEEETVSSLQPEPSVTSSSSSEPGSAPGLAGGEIQPQSRPLEPSPVGGAQATSVTIAVNVPPASTQSRQSSQTTSGQNTTNTSSSASSSATRQGGANPPGPPQSGANPPAPTSAERLAQLDPLGINFDKPKYPAYAVYSTRLSSFDGWPSHMAQTPREMARAGYFYAGYGDYARCFFCGGGLRNWDRTDEPWMEHARWFPRCAFLRNNKGDKYVARVQRRHQEQEAGLQPSSQLPPPVERDEETAIAQALREMGYTNQIIQRSMNNWRRNLKPGRRHPPPMTASAILDIIEILESQDQENTERPGETPLTIPGIDPSAGEVNRVNSGNTAESMTSVGASALEENRTDARLDNQPREYGYDQREKQEKQVLQEDFLGLTETIVCKVCCDKDVAAAFLPCGHLVCCLDCAPAMRRCPLCAELIKGTVKTYFA
ncbi:uncharacterized protein LOC134258339 [Saccostrea cucullata]|uniref:uncharacterized protein LOC134258339 n=1 Tax=Saccostrea cuccullata TaxID=36930 RepID=UPI002ED237A6